MEGKRRIFCVITQGELGGAQRFLATLAQHLDPERFTLHVVWGSDSGAELAGLLPARVSHSIVPHLGRGVWPVKNLRSVWELRRIIADFAPDIVFSLSSMAGFNASLATASLRKSLPDVKVIYRIGGWTFNDPWPQYIRKFYLLLEKISARWKDIIVVNSTHDLDQAHMLGIQPRGKMMRIYNGMDPYSPLVSKEQSRAFLNGRIPKTSGRLPYEYLVGTVANFYPAKDLATLVRAAARVSANVRFVVIGDGAGRGELERLIVQYELQDRFFLLGRVKDASRYLQAFDVFALSSSKEGFPWAVLEAMAAKVPIVATRVGAIPEMLEDHAGIIVPPSAPDQLAEGIVTLLADERTRHEMAIRAHQQVLNKFSLREMVRHYEALFS